MGNFQYRDGNKWVDLFDIPVIKEKWLTNGPYKMYDTMRCQVELENGEKHTIYNRCDNDGWTIDRSYKGWTKKVNKKEAPDDIETLDIYVGEDIQNDWGRTILKAGRYTTEWNHTTRVFKFETKLSALYIDESKVLSVAKLP